MSHRRRLLLRRPLVLGTLFAVACLTPTDGGARFGELRVQPAFSSGEEPETVGITVDSMHVIIRRAGASVARVDTIMPYRTGPLAWVFELETVADDMTVELALRARSGVVYEGRRQITIVEGSVGRAPVENVGVDYTGTVLSDRVEVRPPRLVFSTIGLSRVLDAAVYDAQDNVLAGRQFEWNSGNMAVATVDQAGRVVATGVGSTSIHAAVDGLSDAATVLVDTLLALHGRIDTDSVSLSTGDASTTTVRVRVLDAGGEPVGASAGTVVLDATLGSLSVVADHDDGTYTATFSAGAIAGIARISGTLDGLAIGDTAAVELRATHNEPDPVTSTIDADSAAIDADGTSATRITVTVRDANDNLVGTGGAAVQLSTTLGTLGDVADHGDGTYTATLTAGTVAGDAVITGTLDGAVIEDSAVVTFRPLGVSTTTTTIDADSVAIDADGTSTTRIIVFVRDANGNLVGTGGAAIVLSATLGTLGGVADHGDGTYSAALTAGTVAGNAVIAGTLNGAVIEDSTVVTFRPLGVSTTTTTIDADSVAIDADGTSATRITVTVRDANDNLVGTGGATIALSTTLGALGDVADHGDGTYTATLTAGTVAGDAAITGTLNGAVIEDSTVVTFRPLGVSTTTTTIDADSVAIAADGTSATRITVTVRDANDNLVGTGGASVALSTTLGTLGDVADHGDGTYTATLTAGTVAGNAVIAGTLDGSVIEDTAVVTFRVGEPVLARTTIVSDSASIAANGISSALITVSVFDAHDNPIGRSAGPVELTTSLGLLSDVTDHEDGTYTARLTADTLFYQGPAGGGMEFSSALVNGAPADTAVITGTLNGESIPDTARVELRHEAADPATTTIEADSASIVAGSGATVITVTLRDAAGNRVWSGGPTVILSTTRPGLFDLVNHGDGRYTALLRALVDPGIAVVTGTLDGIAITDSAEVVFRPPR